MKDSSKDDGKKMETYRKLYAEILGSIAKEYVPLVELEHNLCKHTISLQNYIYNKE